MNILIGIFRAVFGTGKKPVLNCVRHSQKYHRKNAHVHRHMQTKPLVAGKAKLPDSVDLRSNDNMKVFDQGDLGSCTANATAAAFHFCEVKEAIREFIPSRLFIYYNARYIEDNIDGEGCSITDAVKSLCEWGVCPESTWPYSDDREDDQPSDSCYAEAAKHVATTACAVGTDINDLKCCLSRGLPFAFGFDVYDSFWSIDSSGMMPMPSSDEGIAGGHAVCAVGYDDSKQVLIVRNSWGQGWGDNGFFYMPYQFVTDVGVFDAWCIQYVQGGDGSHSKKRSGTHDDAPHKHKHAKHRK